MILVDSQSMRELAYRYEGALGARQEIIIAEAGVVLASTLHAYGIDTRLRIAHFLAQTCHESMSYSTTEELADGSAYEQNENLGNVDEGDGVRFKGRGILQLTGRRNYAEYGMPSTSTCSSIRPWRRIRRPPCELRASTGKETTSMRLATMMMSLQSRG